MPEIMPPPAHPIKGLTQQQCIVATMCTHHDKEWWLPADFMKPGEFFVGYEASARLSELQSENPAVFESRRSGKYMARRIKFENGKEWYSNASPEIQRMVKLYYSGNIPQQPIQEALV